MDPDENLKRCLSDWKVEVEIPTRFQAGVWQRISAQEESRSDSLWSRLNQWIAFEFCKPSRAALVVAASLVLSIGTAWVSAQASNDRNWRQLEARYLDSINPLAHETASL